MDKEVRKVSGNLYPKIVYQPKEVKENQIWHFRRFVKNRHGIKLNDYWELYEWCRQNYRKFWESVWIFFDVISSEPYTEVFDMNGSFENPNWFKGAKLNFAENVLRVRSSKTAIIATDERDNEEHISYEQLYVQVAVYAEALKDAGVKKGDVVTCYMSNRAEAVFAYLATASIGAIWCGALPYLGVKVVVSMFKQTNPKLLFAAGNFYFDGKEMEMVQKLSNIVKSLPSLKKVVFVPSKYKQDEIKDLPKCVHIENFLKTAREKITTYGAVILFEQVLFNSPLCINFTSGTTGAPKALLHSHGSLLAPLKDLGLLMDCTASDVLLSHSPVGWVSWNMHVSTLYFGLTLVIYDGNPFEGTPTHFYDIVDKFGITISCIKSSAAENMERKKYIPTEKHSLKSLRAIYAGGSVCKPRTIEFLTSAIKPGLFCCPAYATTEYLGMLSGIDSNLPVYKGEIQCFSLGYDIRTVDEKGCYIVGQRGDIVQVNPTPTSPVSIFGSASKNKLAETYLKKYPGVWDIGDDGWINQVTKGFIVYGRSDEVMKPKATRFNSSDISFALQGFSAISDCICVSTLNSKLDERVVLFVTMTPGHFLTPKVEESLKKTIEENLSYEHVPHLIVEVPEIPYNANGKQCSSLIKKLVNNNDDFNAEHVLNPSSVEFFRNLDLGDF